MDIEARVEKIEKRLADLEQRIARLERLLARRLATVPRLGADVGVDKELIELKKLVGLDEDIPPPSRRH